MPEPVGLADFCRGFEDFFDLRPGSVEGSSQLVGDLGFDSIMMVEVAVLLEEVAAGPVPDELLMSLFTVADVYGYYRNFRIHG
jgi:acyl carrier protein